MKYMGSKNWMLRNGLGELICREAEAHTRVVDLFCGSGVVAWFAAAHTERPVLAVDLQRYAVTLAEAVVARTEPINPQPALARWLRRAEKLTTGSPQWQAALSLRAGEVPVRDLVARARALCTEPSSIGPVWGSYGGYYFSPSQALAFDAMRATLPKRQPEATACLAALICAASECAAAPGHTAQPFKPNDTAGRYILEAWGRDPAERCSTAFSRIAGLHAHAPGKAEVGDATQHAARLQAGDLVVVDPPYSEVQYSRFYHVLETIAEGQCGEVTGEGRYPPIEERPQSAFCRRTDSLNALVGLLETIAASGATGIITFPEGQCSNGLSGDDVVQAARERFCVESKVVESQFSTLGGNTRNRSARKKTRELLLLMRPA